MFNLLPNHSKKIISKDYILRRYAVILGVVVFVQIWLIVFLLPSLVTSYFKNKDLSYQVESMKESNVAKDAGFISDMIVSTNNKLSLYENDFNYPQIVPIIKDVLSYKSQSISFTDFMYEFTGSSSATISLRGRAMTRESLVSFVRNLEASNLFKEVDLPVSNLAKDKDIDFTVNLYFEN